MHSRIFNIEYCTVSLGQIQSEKGDFYQHRRAESPHVEWTKTLTWYQKHGALFPSDLGQIYQTGKISIRAQWDGNG